MSDKASKAAAKVTGALRGVGKALSGQTGILRHLAAEHGETSALMKRAAGGDAKLRSTLFPDIRRRLLAHARAEELEFYPVLKNASSVPDLVTRATEQHRVIEQYVDRLKGENKMSASWTTEIRGLQQAVEEHVRFEEDELFPLAEKHFDHSQLADMLERYQSAEEAEKQRLG